MKRVADILIIILAATGLLISLYIVILITPLQNHLPLKLNLAAELQTIFIVLVVNIIVLNSIAVIREKL